MTSRRLLLMRHAKSSWKHDLPDHERPLNGRGRRDAPRIAAEIAALGWTPQHVLISDSARTVETWRRMAPVLPADLPVTASPALYHAAVGAMRQELARLPDHLTDVLLLAHQPGLAQAIGWWTGHAVEFTTANVARLHGAGPSWADALDAREGWELEAILRPKELPEV